MINDPIKARGVARRVHTGQMYGLDSYWRGHLAPVARTARALVEARPADRGYLDAPDPDDVEITAWLHDAVEDTDMTWDDIEAYQPGSGRKVIEALRLLTRSKDTYADYIEGIRQSTRPSGSLARIVKIADLINNLAGTTKPSLAGRYAKALRALMAVEFKD